MDLSETEATASKRRSYSEDFKRDAVRLIGRGGLFVQSGQPSGERLRCNPPILAREACPEGEALR